MNLLKEAYKDHNAVEINICFMQRVSLKHLEVDNVVSLAVMCNSDCGIGTQIGIPGIFRAYGIESKA